MTSKGIFRLSYLASLLGRSLCLKLFFTLHPWITLLKSFRQVHQEARERKKIVSLLLRRNEELSSRK
ncbi:Hypothetical protein FKW44_013504 [Caligus rogercresseyi]|uniref:Uncharacterized protein n=1 Tax=Caligus rogercresseyi TaxID=217165 RepID=A0A7T8GXU5_CALRO|nr:Hypothetical protein FKW44_013504 [Caligus rogercresseyi]